MTYRRAGSSPALGAFYEQSLLKYVQIMPRGREQLL